MCVNEITVLFEPKVQYLIAKEEKKLNTFESYLHYF